MLNTKFLDQSAIDQGWGGQASGQVSSGMLQQTQAMQQQAKDKATKPVNANRMLRMPGEASQMSADRETNYLANNVTGDEARKAALANVNINDPGITMDWVKGFEMAMNRRESNSRLNMDTANFLGKQTDRFEQKDIMQGMRSAAEAGGFGGVMDYLSVIDPERALKMGQEKQALDQAMLKTDMMSAILAAEKGKAIAEGYGALGEMGAALLNAQPEDRSGMYQQMLPMVKAINPDAPDSFDNKAAGMFMLAQAQATPENILFNSQKNSALYQTELGQAALAINEADKRGMAGTQLYKDLVNKYNAVKAKDDAAQLYASGAQLDVALKQARLNGTQALSPDKILSQNQTFAKNLASASKDAVEGLNNMKQIFPLLDVVKQEGANSPKSAYAINQLRQYIIKSTQGSRPTDKDFEQAAATAGINEISKNVIGWTRGYKQSLNPEEIRQAEVVMRTLGKRLYDQQLATEAQYKQMADSKFQIMENGNKVPIIDWNNTPKPSKLYDGLFAPNMTSSNLQSQAEAAIKNGADPAAVKARLEQLTKGQ